MTQEAQDGSRDAKHERTGTSIVLAVLGYLMTLGLHFAVLAMAIFITVAVGGIFMAYFDQTEVGLPPMTQLTILISRRTANYWYLLIFPGMAIDALLLGLLSYYSPRNFRLASAYSQGCLFAVILLFAFFLLAVAVPIRTLHDFNEQNRAAEVEN